MTISSKVILSTVILLTFISFALKASTNVSGGIYSNFTWTKANSPYIVTDTVVVFPGVTLTIEAGVTVKFVDSMVIEVRQAKVTAIGTSSDSITFTSNSISPFTGVYTGIYLNGGSLTSTFKYCNFRYAKIGINAVVSDSLIISHSDFSLDSTGLRSISTNTEIILIDSSIFNNNINQGVYLHGVNSVLNNCNFISTNTGLILDDAGAAITSCDFLNNGNAGLVMNDEYNFEIITMNYCNFSNNNTGASWFMHRLAINNCNFSNNNNIGMAAFGYFSPLDSYSNTMKNCVFEFNQTGLSNTSRMLIDSCIIMHNQIGYDGGFESIINHSTIDSNSVLGLSLNRDTVINSDIKYNGRGIEATYARVSGNDIEYNTGANINCGGGPIIITGNIISNSAIGINDTVGGTFVITQNVIENNIEGIILHSSNTTMSCNTICNNAHYSLTYTAVNNLDASHNFWCTSDSASIESLIYDGYDNINYGLVSFMPLDTTGCNLTTGIQINKSPNLSFNIFPNPASDNLTLLLPENNSKGTIKIYNMLGELDYTASITKQKTDIDISTFASGIYIVEVSDRDSIYRQKFIKE